MESIEEFFSNLEHPSSPSKRFTPTHHNDRSTLPDAVRQAANRGWKIFPLSMLAKAAARPDLLISEATSDLSRLEELAATYPGCDWRVAAGPSSLSILRLDGQLGRNAFRVLSREQGECLTLQAQRGDAGLAFFRRPAGLVLRNAAKELAPGVERWAMAKAASFRPRLVLFT
jgi:Bifunctional DNA primase/polymerase, N-terminal